MPPNEAERLAAVKRHAVLDTPPDGAFDRVTRLAARIFGVPIATVSIVDHDRIWFKSHHGIEDEQIDREPGLCASAILNDEPWVVVDAEVDPRALANPLVRGELGLRFYAGVPLRTRAGYNLGTLNVIDTKPREVTEEQLATLQDLAAIVVDELELRLAARGEAERLTQARADFIVSASHELRTPLAAIYGVRQIVASLIDNAAKYSPAGGRIEISAEPRDGGVRFRVSDEGIGIPPQEIERIFERFIRLDAELTHGVGGTGLGLYIASELASELGGSLECDPHADTGSTFVLDLPLCSQSSDALT
jgi:signal transduction histidine kinase